MKPPQAKNFGGFLEILYFKMRKLTEDELTSPYKIYSPPPSQDNDNPLPPEIGNILTSPKNPKFQLPPKLSRGGTIYLCMVTD